MVIAEGSAAQMVDMPCAAFGCLAIVLSVADDVVAAIERQSLAQQSDSLSIVARGLTQCGQALIVGCTLADVVHAVDVFVGILDQVMQLDGIDVDDAAFGSASHYTIVLCHCL